MNVVQSVGRQAARAADTALGATVIAAENVADAVRRDPRRDYQRLRRELDTNTRKFERRGAQARKRTTREVNRRSDRAVRAVRRTQRDVESQVDGTRRDVQTATEGFASRVQEQTDRLAS